jgi:hypothetical protein
MRLIQQFSVGDINNGICIAECFLFELLIEESDLSFLNNFISSLTIR